MIRMHCFVLIVGIILLCTEHEKDVALMVMPLNSRYPRPEVPLDQEQIAAAYPLEHSQLEAHPKADLVRESTETEAHKFLSRSVEDIRPHPTDTNHQPVCCDVPDRKTASTPQEEWVSAGESQPARKRSVSHGSNHIQKSEEQRNEPSASIPKVISRCMDAKEPAERSEDKPRKDGFLRSSEGPKPEKLYKSKSETRWGPRPSSNRREEGNDRPVRRSGPIKKPVLRDMKEEREQRKEKEGEKGEEVDKDFYSQSERYFRPFSWNLKR